MTTSYRNNLKESILLLFIAIFSPIVALPFILISIYKKNLYSIYVLGVVLALLIGFMPPYADSYHYYVIYKRTQTFTLSNWLVSTKDFVFYSLCYVFNSWNIPYVLFRLCIGIFEMLVFSWIFVDFIKTRNEKLDGKNIFLITFIMFLTIDLMFVCFMIRFALMATFFILSVYLLNKDKKFIGVFLLFLSLATHFGGFLLLPGVILSIVLRFKISTTKKFILAFIFLCLGLSFFSFLYQFLPDVFKAETYISGTWSDFGSKSFNGMMYYILQYYVLAGIMIFCFMISSPHNNIISRMAFWGSLIFFCICSFSELSQRVWWILKFFIVFSLLESIISNCSKRLILTKLYGLIFLLCFAQMMAIYGFREAVFDRNNIKHSIILFSIVGDEVYDDGYFFRRSISK